MGHHQDPNYADKKKAVIKLPRPGASSFPQQSMGKFKHILVSVAMVVVVMLSVAMVSVAMVTVAMVSGVILAHIHTI